jgi:hypothetical protein
MSEDADKGGIGLGHTGIIHLVVVLKYHLNMNGTGQVSASRQSRLVVDSDPRSSIKSEIDQQSIAIGTRFG